MRESVLEALDELTAWYRDLVAVAVGAERVVVHFDHLDALREDGVPERLAAAERAAETRARVVAPVRGAQPPAEARARGAVHPAAAGAVA